MKKTIYLLIGLCFTISLFSCKKDSNTTTNPTLPPDTGGEISSDNPAKLSAAIKVWHGQRNIGTAPASTGSTPVIDPSINSEIKAFAGRYAIIKPELTSGEIAGYYISISGSGQYFKIDFTKPRITERKKQRKHLSGLNLRPLSGDADSSIVIVLPSDIRVPDTICFTYSPYDSLGHIGQPVTTCIIVNSLGGDVNSAWLQNEWKLTADWDWTNNQRKFLDTVIYNKWRALVADFSTDGYMCATDGYLDLAPRDPSTVIVVRDSVFTRKENLKLAVNGAVSFEEDEDDKTVDYSNSKCSDILFFPIGNYTLTRTGGWSFNSVTNKLTIIFDIDINGNPSDPEVLENDVLKINDKQFILIDSIDQYYSRFER